VAAGWIVRKQAESLARSRMNSVSHSMFLEEQQLSASDQKKAFEAETWAFRKTKTTKEDLLSAL